MIILGIETSCDETAAAVVKGIDTESRVQLLSNIVASSAEIQAKYGGVIPEQAAREQLKAIIPVIEESLQVSGYSGVDIDAIALTYGPGLIGSLLVGVETAKTLATVWHKPLIPINHLLGHFYANFIEVPTSKFQVPKFPCIGLLVSGGHTDLVLFKDHGKYDYLGGTRDDAAGECFDKCARLLNLPYPGGPAIAQSAMKFKIKNLKLKIKLPRPLLIEKTFDFSFSGLKTAVSREVNKLKTMQQWNHEAIAQLAYEIQEAITDVLIEKTIRAVQKYKVEQVMIAGGVAANKYFSAKVYRVFHAQSFIPPPHLCTDNAAMIAAAAIYNFNPVDPLTIQANPALSLESIKP